MVRVVSVDGTHGRKEKVEHAIPNACGSLLKAVCAMTFLLIGLYAGNAFGQMDQGAITGVVQDGTGAIIPAAQVDLTDTDTGLVLHTTTSSSGIYVFSPVKTGHYKVSAGAPGFQTTVQENLQVNIQSTLNVVLTLKAGAANETVTVTTAPVLLETQSASIGQNISRKTIQTTPLNQNNWVYLAHLTAGVTPSTGKTRGSGTGDFMAGGQRAEQNNFMLDGVDNNVNIVDYVNGSSYAIAPPPEALSEFKVETADYSAEFGHSAGAVLNANIKSGTNQIHGSLWEYFRNTDLNAKDWNALTIPAYHMNQFGGTFGTPIIKNKLFYFGDLQDTRMAYSTVGTYSVPTALMREGNFSELLNPALTGQPVVTLYQPGSAGATPLSCNGQANVMCANQINPVAQNILNLYPLPNANGGKTYNNLVENLPI
jgi:Carboxypeptidase regulatory-like domain/TonB-dependent Receptor Plug Domain